MVDVVLRPVGLFEELGFSSSISSGSISAAVGKLAVDASEAERLERYLRSGYRWFQQMSSGFDPLDPTHPQVSSGYLLTDGTWAWLDALPGLINKYRLAVEPEFIFHVRSLAFCFPPVPKGPRYRLPGMVFEDEV